MYIHAQRMGQRPQWSGHDAYCLLLGLTADRGCTRACTMRKAVYIAKLSPSIRGEGGTECVQWLGGVSTMSNMSWLSLIVPPVQQRLSLISIPRVQRVIHLNLGSGYVRTVMQSCIWPRLARLLLTS